MIEIQNSDLTEPEPRPIGTALMRGWKQTCPACGRGRLYRSFLKVADTCPACGEELHHHRADDAPPYFTIVVVGHIVVGGVLLLEQAVAPETWVHYVIWMPMLLLLSLWMLPRIKGALVGLQWALRMHGFGPEPDVGPVGGEPEEAHSARGPGGA